MKSSVFQNVLFYPCSPDQRPLFGAGGAEKTGLAGKGYEAVMTAVRAANPGKTVFHDPAIQVFADGSADNLSEITVLLFIPFRIDFFVFLKMLAGDSIQIALFRCLRYGLLCLCLLMKLPDELFDLRDAALEY